MVTYGGTTIRPTDIEGALYGWVSTRDGAMVVSEPDGSATWFPVNDDPTDKASSRSDHRARRHSRSRTACPPVARSRRRQDDLELGRADPMALPATATIGDFDLTHTPTPDGRRSSMRSTRPAGHRRRPRAARDMLAFFTDHFGPYPFTSSGAIVDDDSVGYALETQSRAGYSCVAPRALSRTSSPTSGTATPSPRTAWPTSGSTRASRLRGLDVGGAPGGATVQASPTACRSRPTTPLLGRRVADPGPAGALPRPRLRPRRGHPPRAPRRSATRRSSRSPSTWVERFGGGTASTTDFISLSEEISGQDLEDFFEVWLYVPEKPVELVVGEPGQRSDDVAVASSSAARSADAAASLAAASSASVGAISP